MKRKMSAVLIALASLSVSPLWAMASRPADPNAAPPPAWVSFMPMLVMVGVFYFLLIRPQMKQRSERQKMLDAVKKVFAKDDVQAVVFGHSHVAMNEKINGVLYFNPGSPNDVCAVERSYGILEVSGGNISGKIVKIG
jgi:hypothetical protein